MKKLGFTKISRLAAPIDMVWDRVTTPDGINDELWPFLKMSVPKGFAGRSVADVAPGTRIGKSLLLAFGMVPIGHDDITVARIVPGRMFREESAMTGMRTWVHHRTLDPAGEETIVTDEISFVLAAPFGALPGADKVATTMLSALFAHRHRRLVRRFGQLPDAAGPGADPSYSARHSSDQEFSARYRFPARQRLR